MQSLAVVLVLGALGCDAEERRCKAQAAELENPEYGRSRLVCNRLAVPGNSCYSTKPDAGMSESSCEDLSYELRCLWSEGDGECCWIVDDVTANCYD